MTDHEDFWEQQFLEASAGEIINSSPTYEQREAAWENDLAKPPKRITLDMVDDLHKIEGLIDGGYLSFIYGSRKRNFGGWGSVKMKYANFLVLMDSGGVRQGEYPLYKSRRNERRDQYPHMRETYEQVKFFREILKSDPMVNTALVEGYEADDLIALLFLKKIGKALVIAQDKDFFMVPGLKEVMTDHSGVPQGYRGLKLPKYAIPPESPGTWVLTQAIFGDKSDSIPRLLPSKGWDSKALYTQIIRQADTLLSAYWNCAAEFGEQFETNLRLVLLPHPTLSNQDYSLVNLLYEDLCDGTYWNPDHYDDHILDQVFTSIKEIEW